MACCFCFLFWLSSGCFVDVYHGNPRFPSFFEIISPIHCACVFFNLHFSWFWGPRVGTSRLDSTPNQWLMYSSYYVIQHPKLSFHALRLPHVFVKFLPDDPSDPRVAGSRVRNVRHGKGCLNLNPHLSFLFAASLDSKV